MMHTGSVCLLTSWIPITFTSSSTRELLRSLHMAKVETYKSIFPKSLAQLLELAGQNACFSHLLYPPSRQRDGAVSEYLPIPVTRWSRLSWKAVYTGFTPT